MFVEFEKASPEQMELVEKSNSFMVRSLVRWEVAKSEAQANLALVLIAIILFSASFSLLLISNVTETSIGFGTRDLSSLVSK